MWAIGQFRLGLTITSLKPIRRSDSTVNKGSAFDCPFLLVRRPGLNPGEEKTVTLVAFGGNRLAQGLNGLTEGLLNDPSVKAKAVALAKERGFDKKTLVDFTQPVNSFPTFLHNQRLYKPKEEEWYLRICF